MIQHVERSLRTRSVCRTQRGSRLCDCVEERAEFCRLKQRVQRRGVVGVIRKKSCTHLLHTRGVSLVALHHAYKQRKHTGHQTCAEGAHVSRTCSLRGVVGPCLPASHLDATSGGGLGHIGRREQLAAGRGGRTGGVD